VTGFREHVLDKYFSYRRRYVAYFEDSVPARASLANAAEIARLCFMLLGCALFAAIFWIVTVAAFSRTGIAPSSVLLALCAALTTACALLAMRGLYAASADRARVARRVRG